MGRGVAEDVERIRVVTVPRREDLDLLAVGRAAAGDPATCPFERTSTACFASFGPMARAASSPEAPSGSSSSDLSGRTTFISGIGARLEARPHAPRPSRATAGRRTPRARSTARTAPVSGIISTIVVTGSTPGSSDGERGDGDVADPPVTPQLARRDDAEPGEREDEDRQLEDDGERDQHQQHERVVVAAPEAGCRTDRSRSS